jgi:hypothetical protein
MSGSPRTRHVQQVFEIERSDAGAQGLVSPQMRRSIAQMAGRAQI